MYKKTKTKWGQTTNVWKDLHKVATNYRCMERLTYSGDKHRMYGKTNVKWGQTLDERKV